jgi:hypothetical protein
VKNQEKISGNFVDFWKGIREQEKSGLKVNSIYEGGCKTKSEKIPQ